MIAQGGAHAERSSRVRNPGIAGDPTIPTTPKAWPEMEIG